MIVLRFALAAAIGIIVSIAIGTTPAIAWGATGHQAVCEIAYDQLTPKAKRWVDRIMAAETDTRFKTFHEGCGWPDARTAATNARRSEHFVNLPRDMTNIPSADCVGAAKCLFTAIPTDIAMLKNSGASRIRRLQALKFLGHWIGDIHQPLHISYEDDRGGNSISVLGVAGCASDGKTALHSVWDTCTPEQIMRDMDIANTPGHLGSGREKFGDALGQEISASDKAKWTTSMDPLIWAQESYDLARAADVGYCFKSGGKCRYASNKDEYTGGALREFSPQGDYERDHADTVKSRILAAGVRLGAVINEIVGDLP